MIGPTTGMISEQITVTSSAKAAFSPIIRQNDAAEAMGGAAKAYRAARW